MLKHAYPQKRSQEQPAQPAAATPFQAHTKANSPEITKLDAALRPTNFAEYLGQTKLKKNLQVFLKAAQKRQEPLEHTLFYGPPGLGKTTLANVLAQELKVNLKVISGPVLEKAGDLAALLTNLKPHDLLFIDEIHRLRLPVEEVLYSAMEDFVLDLILGKGPAAKTLRLKVAPFTLVGATTKFAGLSGPLRNRFGQTFRLEFYSIPELTEILLRSARLLKVQTTAKVAEKIARASRGTPRIANRLLRRLRDFAEVEHNGAITEEVVTQGLAKLEVDPIGIDYLDRKILEILTQKFGGQPVGLSTLAAALSEEAETIETIIEPFLLQHGLIERTPRGRLATPRAFEFLGLNPKVLKCSNRTA